MKSLLFFLSFFLCGIVNATTYYFSSTTGDDTRTSAQAQNSATPWKTLSKLNSFFSSLNPGDNVFLKRGDVFTGSITVSTDGAAGSPITIGAYGTGAKPLITGFASITGWTNVGGNIWQSNSAVTTLSTLNMVAINGANTAMGRYPNSGYLTYQSHSGNSSITSSSLNSSTTNWTGAEAVIRMYRWVIDRNKINSHSGGTLNYTANGGDYDPTNNFGFFIQNDSRTLDAQNEWYFDPTTKKLKIYSSTSPVNVQVATVATLLSIAQKDYITLDNLSFQGSNDKCIYNNTGKYFVVNACDINYSGTEAINAYPNSPYVKIENCTISNSNNAALYLGTSQNVSVKFNTITNTGIFHGMGKAINSTFEGITSSGNNCVISNNSVVNTGYCGIKFDGDATVVSNNFINNFCFVKDDGGGIYTYPSAGPRAYIKRTIKNNIVINSTGAALGTNSTESSGHGVYQDGNSSDIDYIGNLIANVGLGLFLHGPHETTLDGNTIYNCDRGLFLIKYNTVAMNNITNVNNIFFARLATQYPAYFEPMSTVMPSSFVSDNNYYVRPLADNNTIFQDQNGTNVYHTLTQWKSYTGKDANSKKSPVTTTNVNDIRLEYNETSVNKTISLGATYIDVKSVSYNGTITLAPYTSAVLIKTGTSSNVPPTSNAGTDKTITLPTALVSLTGTGTDPDGTISSYLWTKVSGPTGSIITNSTSASTTITALLQGVYVFQLKVTDNGGSTATDNLQVTVNATTTNQLPSSNAGSDQIVTLPTNSVSLTGSGSDPDGTIASYLWSKSSGPSGGTLSAATSATTSVTGLLQGIYIYQLKVTDNSGGIATDNVQVTVNAAATIKIIRVNIYNGTVPYNDVRWNNWKPVTNVASTNYKYEDGTQSNVNGKFSGQKKILDNGAGYMSTSSACPGEVLRYTSASQTSRTITMSGLNPAKKYTFEFFASSALSGNQTEFVINGSAYTVNTYNNKNGYAEYFNITPTTGGTVVVSLNTIGTWNYLSAFQIVEQNGTVTSRLEGGEAEQQFSKGPVTDAIPEVEAANVTTISTFPLPFTTSFKVNISGKATGTYILSLIDMSGKMVWKKAIGKTGSTITESINTSNLLRGVYILEVVAPDFIRTAHKVIKN